MEGRLRAAGLDGYGGGILLFRRPGGRVARRRSSVVIAAAHAVRRPSRGSCTRFCVYSLLALGDLLHHVWRIEAAVRARRSRRARVARSARWSAATPIAWTAPACRRAAVESLSENLTDGFVSPVFWYVLAGLPGLVLFKVVSTMDSMVGYKTPRYLPLRLVRRAARRRDELRAGAADVAGRLPAVAAVLPRLLRTEGLARRSSTARACCSVRTPDGAKPATAGALERRIVGPIWLNGVLVTDLWIGDPADPPLESADDMRRAVLLAVSSGLAGALAALALGAGLP